MFGIKANFKTIYSWLLTELIKTALSTLEVLSLLNKDHVLSHIFIVYSAEYYTSNVKEWILVYKPLKVTVYVLWKLIFNFGDKVKKIVFWFAS